MRLAAWLRASVGTAAGGSLEVDDPTGIRVRFATQP